VQVEIRYHSLWMLRTLDLNHLVQVLFDEYGGDVSLSCIPMTESERGEVTTNHEGIDGIQERFWIVEDGNNSQLRRTDLEMRTVDFGQK